MVKPQAEVPDKPGIVRIHGKEYQTVAKRIADFRAKHPDHQIESEVLEHGDTVLIKATISNEIGTVLATGYAEEVRDSTNINKTSALENCETSAVGRALAFAGWGGTQIASADEVNSAIIAGAKKEVADYFIMYSEVVRSNITTIFQVKEALANDDYLSAVAVWSDLSHEEQATIYKLAPTKGGILTTEERDKIKSNEFNEVASA